MFYRIFQKAEWFSFEYYQIKGDCLRQTMIEILTYFFFRPYLSYKLVILLNKRINVA